MAIGRRPAFATTGLAIAATRGGLPDAVPRCLHHLSCHLLNFALVAGTLPGTLVPCFDCGLLWFALSCPPPVRCVGAREPR